MSAVDLQQLCFIGIDPHLPRICLQHACSLAVICADGTVQAIAGASSDRITEKTWLMRPNVCIPAVYRLSNLHWVPQEFSGCGMSAVRRTMSYSCRRAASGSIRDARVARPEPYWFQSHWHAGSDDTDASIPARSEKTSERASTERTVSWKGCKRESICRSDGIDSTLRTPL